MRHLATLFVFAAAIAVTAPASAQDATAAPDATRGAREWAQPGPRPEHAARPERARPRRHHAHIRHPHRGWRSPADSMANRLNRRQLRGGAAYYYPVAPAYGGTWGPSPYSPSGY
jgi:hypothetical protein